MSDSQRIGYLVSQYPAVNHTYILREIRELRRLGWDIRVASIRSDERKTSQLTAEEQEERIQTLYVKAQGLTGAVRAHLSALVSHAPSYLKGLLFALSLGGADIGKAAKNMLHFTEALIVGHWMQDHKLRHIHVHYASAVGLLVAKTFPVAVSTTIHGSAEFEEPITFHLREKIEASKFVCAISRYGRSQLMKASDPDQWQKLEVVPLGIDPERFVPGAANSIENSTFEIISVGQLAPAKAQRILFAAVVKLIRDGRNVILRLVGDGPDRLALEKYVADNDLSGRVYLEGALNQDQLKVLYEKSHVFVLASFAEGVPVVLMEAMAMEIPCVATRITGIPELIEDGVEGLLVTPSDAEQLAMAIARLMDDSNLRKRIGSAGRRKVLQNYDLTKNVAQLAEVFERWLLN
jgi:colanic acid/amylovoran biosynthesis glycosyltransferase